MRRGRRAARRDARPPAARGGAGRRPRPLRLLRRHRPARGRGQPAWQPRPGRRPARRRAAAGATVAHRRVPARLRRRGRRRCRRRPRAPFDRNGTFVVYRKLAMDVAAFRRFVAERGDYPGGAELLAAKIVGRWPDGTPLALSPDAPGRGGRRRPARASTTSRYARRPGRAALPARRAHPPRQPARRRSASSTAGSPTATGIIRRGRAYGPPLAAGRRSRTTASTAAWSSSASRPTSGASSRRSRRSGSTTATRSASARDKDFLIGEPHGTEGKMTIQGDPPFFLQAAAAVRDAARRRVPVPAVDERPAGAGEAEPRRVMRRRTTVYADREALDALGPRRAARRAADGDPGRGRRRRRPACAALHRARVGIGRSTDGEVGRRGRRRTDRRAARLKSALGGRHGPVARRA